MRDISYLLGGGPEEPAETSSLWDSATSIPKALFNLPRAGVGLAAGLVDPAGYMGAFEQGLEDLAPGREPTLAEAYRAAPGIGDVLQQHGILAPQQDAPIGNALRTVGKLGVDIATDPLSYLTAGESGAARVVPKAIGLAAAGLYGPETLRGTYEGAKETLNAQNPQEAIGGGIKTLLMGGLSALMAKGAIDDVAAFKALRAAEPGSPGLTPSGGADRATTGRPERGAADLAPGPAAETPIERAPAPVPEAPSVPAEPLPLEQVESVPQLEPQVAPGEPIAAPQVPPPLDEATIRQVMPDAQLTPAKGGFLAESPGGHQVTILPADSIQMPEGGTAKGSFTPAEGGDTIHLTPEDATKTLLHEQLHQAFQKALTPSERYALEKHYGSEEAAAEAYANWSPANTQHSVFGKVSKFFRQFAPDADSVLTKIRSGEVLERRVAPPVPPVVEGAGLEGPKPSFRPDEPLRGTPQEKLKQLNEEVLAEFNKEPNLAKGEEGKPQGAPDIALNLSKYEAWSPELKARFAGALEAANPAHRRANPASGEAVARAVQARRQVISELGLESEAALAKYKAEPGNLELKKSYEDKVLAATEAVFQFDEPTHAARVLAAMRDTVHSDPTDRVIKMLQKLGLKEKQVAELASLAETDPRLFAEHLRANMKYTKTDMLVEAFKAGLVSNPLTRVVNILGNSTKRGLSDADQAVASALDATRVKFFGGERQRFLGENKWAQWGMQQFAPEALDNFIANKGGFKLGPVEKRLTGSSLEHPPGAIPNVKIFGKTIPIGDIYRIPFNQLEVDDDFFKTIAAANNIGREAYRWVRKTTGLQGAERDAAVQRVATDLMDAFKKGPGTTEFKRFQPILERVHSMMLDDTWQTPTGRGIAGLQAILREHPALQFILPFVKTPVNITKDVLSHSPAAFLAGPASLANLWKNRKNLSPEQLDALSKAVVGSGITSLVATYAMGGGVTGSLDPDPKKRQMLQNSGIQPYSFKIGKDYYSYQRLAPIGQLIGTAADMAEAAKRGDLESVDRFGTTLLSTIQNNLTDQTFLSGLQGFLAAMRNHERDGRAWVKQLMGSTTALLPFGGAIAGVARAQDPTARQIDLGVTKEGPPAPIQARIPGLSEKLPPRRSASGQEVPRAGGSFIERFLSPFSRTTIKDEGLAHLAQEMQSIDYTPSAVDNAIRIDGKTVYLTKEELAKLNAANKKATEVAIRAVKNPTYLALPPNEDAIPEEERGRNRKTRKDVLEAIYRRYRSDILAAIRARATRRLAAGMLGSPI